MTVFLGVEHGDNPILTYIKLETVEVFEASKKGNSIRVSICTDRDDDYSLEDVKQIKFVDSVFLQEGDFSLRTSGMIDRLVF